MIDIKLAHYVTSRDVEWFNVPGMNVIFYVPSHRLYVMHPRIFDEFRLMMISAGFELLEFGENNA